MESRLRRKSRGDHFGTPVEMRFIDMFMAALGALIFLSMLLSFLLQHIPIKLIDIHSTPTHPEKGPLRLLTRLVPPAEVGQPYEIAFAYRGGVEPISWAIVAGEDELSSGLGFSSSDGILSGTPAQVGLSRFVLRVIDASGKSEEQAYELRINEEKKSGRKAERWLAGIMLLTLIVIWLSTCAAVHNTKKFLLFLQDEQAKGRRKVTIETGQGVLEQVILPEGITTYRKRLKAARQFCRIVGLATLLLGCWFAWRVFFI